MKVLLWQDIEKLGKRGDIVEVADGYARNYLIPKKIATPPTESCQNALEVEKKRFAVKEAKVARDLKVLAEQITKVSLTVEANANEEGHLYGSITPAMIVDALKGQGIIIDSKTVDIGESIKQVGFYEIKIKLQKDIESAVKVWIIAIGAKEKLEEKG